VGGCSRTNVLGGVSVWDRFKKLLEAFDSSDGKMEEGWKSRVCGDQVGYLHSKNMFTSIE
jgi:hypothetical protein